MNHFQKKQKCEINKANKVNSNHKIDKTNKKDKANKVDSNHKINKRYKTNSNQKSDKLFKKNKNYKVNKTDSNNKIDKKDNNKIDNLSLLAFLLFIHQKFSKLIINVKIKSGISKRKTIIKQIIWIY